MKYIIIGIFVVAVIIFIAGYIACKAVDNLDFWSDDGK